MPVDPETVKVNVTLHASTRARLEAEAWVLRRTLPTHVAWILNEHIERMRELDGEEASL